MKTLQRMLIALLLLMLMGYYFTYALVTVAYGAPPSKYQIWGLNIEKNLFTEIATININLPKEERRALCKRIADVLQAEADAVDNGGKFKCMVER